MANFCFYIVLVLVVFACDGGVSANRIYPELTTPANATEKGAVCLDGSEPAYQHDIGYGNGSNSWTIHLEGGGWCNNYTHCVSRIYHVGMGGRSKMSRDGKGYSGIQNPNATANPYFYNWNKVYVRYCDGASFFADVEEPKQVGNTTLYFRGARIFTAVVEDLLEKGMKSATNVLLSGNSAGGLANLLYCDKFRALLPNTIPRVKCVADASFFLHGKDLPGLELREGPVFSIVETHGLAKRFPVSCTSKVEARLCLFPEYFADGIQTPLFMVQSAYDVFQTRDRLEHFTPFGNWSACYKGKAPCVPDDQKAIKDFGTELVGKLPNSNGLSRGFFVDSCSYHDQILDDKWNHVPQPTLNNKTIAQAVADWFFDRSSFQVINKTDFPINCDK